MEANEKKSTELLRLVQIMEGNGSLSYYEKIKPMQKAKKSKLVITGTIPDPAGDLPNYDIKIVLWFSIAPSLQSMLSRGGRVTVAFRVLINDVFAMYDSDITRDAMDKIGSTLARNDQALRKSQELETYKIIENATSSN